MVGVVVSFLFSFAFSSLDVSSLLGVLPPTEVPPFQCPPPELLPPLEEPPFPELLPPPYCKSLTLNVQKYIKTAF